MFCAFSDYSIIEPPLLHPWPRKFIDECTPELLVAYYENISHRPGFLSHRMGETLDRIEERLEELSTPSAAVRFVSGMPHRGATPNIIINQPRSPQVITMPTPAPQIVNLPPPRPRDIMIPAPSKKVIYLDSSGKLVSSHEEP
jgi:hypothetical protein